MTQERGGVIPNQVELWNKQHSQRGVDGIEARYLRDIPNESAIIFANNLKQIPSTILEVGSANGRDARHWASLGHNVVCTDFSPVALDQLDSIARSQGVRDNLQILLHDINTGKLPDVGIPLHGFYGRSALHVDDETMMSVAEEIDVKLSSQGIILIEGKGEQDHKIARSVFVKSGLVSDPVEGGHIRRVWTEDFMLNMCSKFKWNVNSIETRHELHGESPIKFLRLIASKP